ncbi:uncharacterized protein LOC122078178 [Macadamia integrifolia]|uniref:uncharacterized protein LOC122078178 n=1 Tax=Macadamia integrifolia TaxID=60698 RepID=UPI001C4E8CFB|nr:uncharacterized protein LOC122078178 [Macadamia integrifolia]
MSKEMVTYSCNSVTPKPESESRSCIKEAKEEDGGTRRRRKRRKKVRWRKKKKIVNGPWLVQHLKSWILHLGDRLSWNDCHRVWRELNQPADHDVDRACKRRGLRVPTNQPANPNVGPPSQLKTRDYIHVNSTREQ